MHIQGKPEEPGRGKEKESSGQGSKGGKKSLNLNEDFPTFLTQEIISETSDWSRASRETCFSQHVRLSYSKDSQGDL